MSISWKDRGHINKNLAETKRRRKCNSTHICPGCGQGFRTEETYRQHYKERHAMPLPKVKTLAAAPLPPGA